MALGINYGIQPQDFAMSNPALTGFSQMASLNAALTGQQLTNQANAIRNQYLQPSLAQSLQKQQYSNQVLGAQAGVAPQMAQAGLQQAQAQPQLTTAQAGLASTEAAKNQFYLNHPGMLAPGLAGQIAGVQYVQGLQPNGGNSAGGSTPAPPANAPAPTSAPQLQPMPSQPGATSAAILNSPYAVQPGKINSLNDALGAVTSPNPNGAAKIPNAPIGDPSGYPSINDSLAGLPQLMVQGVASQNKKNIAQADLDTQKANAYNYTLIPQPQRDSMVAQAAGMGYDPGVATQMFVQGQTIGDLAKAKGFNPSNLPNPIWPTTPGAQQQIQQMQMANAKINSISPWMVSSMAPYSQKFQGYSPKQIGEALMGENPDAAANYIAATILQPEYSSGKLQQMGVHLTKGAIDEVQAANLGQSKILQPFITPAMYAQAQNIANDKMNMMTQAATNVGLHPGVNSYQPNSINSALQGNGQQQAGYNAPPGVGGTQQVNRFTDDDIAYTAQKYGLTIAQVRQHMGLQ